MISIVMPAFNASAFIAEGIGSILAQEHRPLEIIVIDDGSADDTAAIVTAFGKLVRFHRQAHAGAPSARNYGLSLVSGELVTFLDSDDLFEKNKLGRQLLKLQNNPEIDIVLGGLRHFQQTNAEQQPASFPQTQQDDRLILQLSCGLFRRSVFDRVGLFDVLLRQCDDWDWFMRARELRVGMLLHRDIVVNHRLHSHNLTRDRSEVVTYQAMMFKRALDRRRAGGENAPLPPLSSFFEPAPLDSDERNV